MRIEAPWLHFLYALHVHEALNATAGLRPTLEAGFDVTLLRLLFDDDKQTPRLCRTNTSVAHLLPRPRQPMVEQVAGMCPLASRGMVACKHRSPRCTLDARFPGVGPSAAPTDGRMERAAHAYASLAPPPPLARLSALPPPSVALPAPASDSGSTRAGAIPHAIPRPGRRFRSAMSSGAGRTWTAPRAGTRATNDSHRNSREGAMPPAHIGTSYCTTTVDGWEGDCQRGLLGTWAIPAGLAQPNALSWCFAKCRACARCRFVSVSHANRDCSWYVGCAVSALGLVYGGASYATYQIQPAQADDVCANPASRPYSAGLAPHATAADATVSAGQSVATPPPAGGPAVSHIRAGVHLVTFYSEGPPRDRGIPLGEMAALLEAAFAPHVDSFRAYTPADVRAMSVRGLAGARVVQPSAVEASMNTGLSAIGQLAAKPYIILHRLLELPSVSHARPSRRRPSPTPASSYTVDPRGAAPALLLHHPTP